MNLPARVNASRQNPNLPSPTSFHWMMTPAFRIALPISNNLTCNPFLIFYCGFQTQSRWWLRKIDHSLPLSENITIICQCEAAHMVSQPSSLSIKKFSGCCCGMLVKPFLTFTIHLTNSDKWERLMILQNYKNKKNCNLHFRILCMYALEKGRCTGR